MKISDALKEAMHQTKTSQKMLAERVGVRNQSTIAMRLKQESIGVNNVIEMLDALGYELVIQEKKRGRRAEGQMVITLEDGNEDE